MGETDTQLDEPGRGVYVGKDKIIHEKENWSWKGGWTERGGRGAGLGAEARPPEASGRLSTESRGDRADATRLAVH